jgi:hypothetical protein
MTAKKTQVPKNKYQLVIVKESTSQKNTNIFLQAIVFPYIFQAQILQA